MRADPSAGREDAPRLLTREACEAIIRRVFAMAQGGGETRVQIDSWWQGELRWARNRVSLASDRRDVHVWIARGHRFSSALAARVSTNQLDDESLMAAVREAERQRALTDDPQDPAYAPERAAFEAPTTAIWSDATFGLTAEARGAAARALVDPAEAAGMLSAGYIEVRGAGRVVASSAARAGQSASPELPYTAWTQAQCSMTVRDPRGTGSGWAGLSSYDWNRIDAPSLAARALDKCLRSRNPVGLEPGRYTVILEPQAVADLAAVLVGALDRRENERQPWPFTVGFDDALRLWRTKLGQKVLDERLTLGHDFADPDLGTLARYGDATAPVAWIRNGVLERLSHDRAYAIGALNAPAGTRPAHAFRMSGGTTTLDEMIRTTRRGLLVTRFSHVRKLDDASLLSSGLTRDGLWLVENGAITKPVKNLRFTESPLFVFNSIEQLGPPMRVFRPASTWSEAGLIPAVVPPLKARDFSFTSLVEAV